MHASYFYFVTFFLMLCLTQFFLNVHKMQLTFRTKT